MSDLLGRPSGAGDDPGLDDRSGGRGYAGPGQGHPGAVAQRDGRGAVVADPTDDRATDLPGPPPGPTVPVRPGEVAADPETVWTPARQLRLGLQLWLAGALAAMFVDEVRRDGVPIDREQVILWLMAALGIWAIGSGAKGLIRVVRDWLPFGAVLIVYDYSRGAADGLGRSVNFTPQIDFDKWIGLGEVPTVRLQHWLIKPDTAWWEVLVSLTYISHFIVPFVVAAVLWVRDRPRWARFVQRFVVLSFVAVATFILFPAAPPWMAGEVGYIDPVQRTVGRGWTEIGFHTAARLLDKGQGTVNTVAAIPSLHEGYATLVAVTLWPKANWFVRSILATYVLFMGFSLVLAGEHYVADLVVAWIMVAAVCFAIERFTRWLDAQRGQPHLP